MQSVIPLKHPAGERSSYDGTVQSLATLISRSGRRVRRAWHPLLAPCVMAFGTLTCALPAHAQDAAPGEVSPPAQGYELLDLFMFSPVINGMIAGLSVLALALFALLILTINTRAMAPSDMVEEVRKLVQRRQFEKAGDVCRRHRRVFVSSVVQRCLDHVGQPPTVLHGVIDAEGRRRADVIWNRVSYLADISNVAPMLGLFGTVVGMIRAFFSLEFSDGSANAKLLSQGIGQAMATTLFGLAVGILSLALYSIVKGRTTRTLADAESAVTSIADEIVESDRYARSLDTPSATSVSSVSSDPGMVTPPAAVPAHPLRRATDPPADGASAESSPR